MKGDRMAKRSSFGSIVRKRLSDITNSIPQTRSPVPAKKLSPTNSSEKEYINQLVKENLELVKIIADKNKMIELTALELQKMRVHLQKMQLQNWNLAQSNSHITAELNLGKEKLKALQHEIVCKDAVLKAKNLELEEKAKTRNRSSCSQPGDGVVEEHNSHDERRPGKGQRRRVTRSPSIGPSNTLQQLADKDTTGNKRRCLRRKSTSFESQQQEAQDKSVEITGTKSTLYQSLVSPLNPNVLGSSRKIPEKDGGCAARSEARGSQWTSSGRPLRRSVKKVSSYKEIPLNVKIRRSG